MVDGPNLSIRPLVPAPRAAENVTPATGPTQSRSQSTASSPAGASATDHLVSQKVAGVSTLDARTTLSEMPLSILNSATLTRAEWGWRGLLSNFLAEMMAHSSTPSSADAVGAGAKPGTTVFTPSMSSPTPSDTSGLGDSTVSNLSGAGQDIPRAAQIGTQSELAAPTAAASSSMTATPPQSEAWSVPTSQLQTSIDSQGAAPSQALLASTLPSGTPQAGNVATPMLPQTAWSPPSAPPSQTALPAESGPTAIVNPPHGSKAEAPGSVTPAFHQQVTTLVSTMRQVMNILATNSAQKSWETIISGSVGAPTLVPFGHVTSNTTVKEQSGTVEHWTLLDRMGAAVQDAQAPVFGGGMLLLPQGGDVTRAVKWRAHRSSQPTRTGQTVHRLVIDFQVYGRPARATLITSRPEMAVYVQTNDNRLRALLEGHRPGLQSALSETGWSLEHFHVGSLEDDGGVMS